MTARATAAPRVARHANRAFLVIARDANLRPAAYGCRACDLRIVGVAHDRALALYKRHACGRAVGA